jgi:hypothetical protein
MDDQNTKVNDVNGDANNGQAPEPENVISTKEAIKAIAHNTKVGAVKAWDRAKPKLKKAVVAAAIIGGGLWAYDKLTQQQAIEKSDDGDFNGQTLLYDDYGQVIGTVEGNPETTEPETETPAENAE